MVVLIDIMCVYVFCILHQIRVQIWDDLYDHVLMRDQQKNILVQCHWMKVSYFILYMAFILYFNAISQNQVYQYIQLQIQFLMLYLHLKIRSPLIEYIAKIRRMHLSFVSTFSNMSMKYAVIIRIVMENNFCIDCQYIPCRFLVYCQYEATLKKRV